MICHNGKYNGAIRMLNAYDHRHRRIRKIVQRLAVSVSQPPAPPVETREWQMVATHTYVWDPACGCGNFLLIAYRELRRLEMDILEELYGDSPAQFLDISQLCKVSVSQFHGIEIEPFPAEIAKVALWLMDHLCNMEVADWPRPPDELKEEISCAAQIVLDVRKQYMDADERCSLAALYDSTAMPPDLVKAHAHLDALVDKAYGLSPAATDAERVAHLFKLYAAKVKEGE